MFLDVTLKPRKEEKQEVKKVIKQYNWMYENSINNGKAVIDMNKPQEFEYNKWRTNSSLSNDIETLFVSNQMNMNYHLSDKMHYEYLYYSVKKKFRGKKKSEEEKKREAKLKQETEAEMALIHLIQDYYKYNLSKAKDAMTILGKDEINYIKQKQEKGGMNV